MSTLFGLWDATTKGGAASSKTSLLDRAVRYLLNGDASPDRSAEEIWLMGARLPRWGREDDARVAAAAEKAEKAGSKSSNGSGSGHSHSHATARMTSKSRDFDLSLSHAASSSEATWMQTPSTEQKDRPPQALARRLPRRLLRTGLVHVPGPIRDLPSLSLLPPTSPRMQHSPSQSESSYSSASSSSRGESGSGGAG
ncbi:hypothetical protein K438DRAFT_1970690 [Mycena galopus ATCC 62051]|nr:hypothetical protein K438DRAFT_1970690 [Mycena galopus ATCC 62051]